MRILMVARAVIALSVCSVAFAAAAFAWESGVAGPPAPTQSGGPISGVSFEDPHGDLAEPFEFTAGGRSDTPLRLSEAVNPAETELEGEERRYEFSITAPSRVTGLGVDLGLAPRASFSTDTEGRLSSAGAGAEVRIGQGLENLIDRWEPPTWDAPAWYFFAASDGQALAWSPEQAAGVPGARGDGLRWQDRVEVGDFQAGLSVEAGGMQASLAYVQRNISTQHGSSEENFAGVTVTFGR
jgi:hypothetical protein